MSVTGFRRRSWQKARVNVERHRWLYQGLVVLILLAAVANVGLVVAGIVLGEFLRAARVTLPLLLWSWLGASYLAMLRRDDPEPPRYYFWRPGV